MRFFAAIIIASVPMATPVFAASLSGPEKAAYVCILQRAKSEPGNAMVAAGNAAEKCPMGGLSEAQKEKVVGMAIRRLMQGSGQRCIGTGCG